MRSSRVSNVILAFILTGYRNTKATKSNRMSTNRKPKGRSRVDQSENVICETVMSETDTEATEGGVVSDSSERTGYSYIAEGGQTQT